MSTAFPIVSWGNGTNIYEVNIRQYTHEGTLKAFIEHIPRLHSMGIDILWLMPVTPISMEKRQGTFGSYYAAASYTIIDPSYGTADDFRELIKTAHYYEMKVIIDWVANHTGYDHVWTKEYPEWYRKDEAGNFTELYGWIDVIDLNYEVPELRRGMISAMKHWVEMFDIDGFRCDMARTVPIDFWIEARAECDELKPLFWLAECEIIEYHEAFDLTYGWEAMRALDKYMKGELPLDDIKKILVQYANYPIGSRKLLFTSNHDENTYHGTEYEKYGVAARAMAAFTCTWPGIPLIYSGQEKPNYKRLEFFEKDFIDWSGDVELHDFYKTLLTLRKKNKALQESASVLMFKTTHTDVLAYLCSRQKDKVLALLNLGKEKATFSIDHPALAGSYHDLFKGTQVDFKRSKQFSFDAGEFSVLHITGEAAV
ncbi:1,4-alpha-glucan branching protein [Panacibacter sp. DH6]|uniref:1,4-alpha-glucan branching protein n=1 Tax=Panacibacter microcysteis TaxID=2793269 RepID=A0A931E397_9BACT|nr:alpha-amylase family glycosyl hydrolase [Panacibacter microcysteis]MBG9375332.1 1,4-alpha-glucan branching protein [Panacibacter microcysteis]